MLAERHADENVRTEKGTGAIVSRLRELYGNDEAVARRILHVLAQPPTPSQSPVGRYRSSFLNRLFGIGNSETMTNRLGFDVGVVVVIASSVICGSVRADGPSIHRVRAVMLDTETSVRTTVNNRDSYLIRIMPRHGQPFLARMIDNFPPYADPLPDYLRSQGTTFSVELWRATFCDQNQDRKTNPMNRMSDSEIDQAPEAITLASQDEHPGGVTRCFIAVHGSWKNAKGEQKDEWWK